MAVNLKLGVDYSSFKQGLEQAEASVKQFDAALAKNEAQLKKTGDAEEYMRQKSAILQQQIEAQQKVVDQYKDALQKMQDSGNAGSKAFQTMTTNLLKAETKLTKMETDLQNVGKESKSADTELRNIGKNITWSNVSEGLKKITDQLERGARAAINFGKRVARSAMDSTAWADDVLTRATQYGIDAETLQKMENVADYIDTDVDTIISARDRLAKNRESLPELLGISTDGKSADDLFWEAGEAIMNLGEAFDKSEIAQKVFGRGWRELLPLFTAGRDTYEEMMDQQNVLTNEQVENLGKADDAIKSFQQQIELMKNQFWADNADKITELLQWLIDNKDGVVTALMGIAGAFGAIKIVEFASSLTQVINGFKTLGFLGGTGATGTGGTPVVAPTGTGGTGGGLLNNLMLAGVSGAFYNATEGRLARESAAYESSMAGMSESEKSKKMVMDAFHWSEADWYRYHYGGDQNTSGRFFGTGETPEITVAPVVEEGAASDITEQVGTVDINGIVHIVGVDGANLGVSGDWWGGDGSAVRPHRVPGHANGLPWVPTNGLYMLHRGEQVVPAREVAHRNYSSNLYVESMYMNNGTDAEGLASAMAAAQRRTMSGFGS